MDVSTLSWPDGCDSEVSMLGDSPLVKLHNSRAAYKKFVYTRLKYIIP